MLGMIHGQGSKNADMIHQFWSMVRYGQEHGKDATCRKIILDALGEVTLHVDRSGQSEDDVKVKDILIHARIVKQILADESVKEKNLTIRQLAQFWRGKDAPTL